MEEKPFNKKDKGWKSSLSVLRLPLIALASGGLFIGIALATGYGPGSFSSGTYGGGVYGTGDAAAPATSPAAPSGGGGMIVGSGPLAPSAAGVSGIYKPLPQKTSAATSSNPLTPTAGATSTPPLILTKNRQLYDRGEDVRALQKFFNTHGFVIAQSGPGSPGNETSVFGPNTYRTVIKFQKSNNLPATGYLGPLTRASLRMTSSSGDTAH
jgi:hypothetical protein